MKQQDYFDKPFPVSPKKCQLSTFSFFKTIQSEILKEQDNLNKVLSKLSEQEKELLHNVFLWLQEEQTKTIEHNFGKEDEE